MSPMDVFWYIANGVMWFLAGVYSNILITRRKERHSEHHS